MKRYLGLELGGSRRTAVACLEHHPAQGKVFLRELHANLHGSREETADEALLRVVRALGADVLAVDAPLTLPPCFSCALPGCPGVEACPQESVAWMREEAARRRWPKSKFPPPYTHRPVDLLMRGRWQDDLPAPIPAEEALGSGRAPLTARMSYLRSRLGPAALLETSPRFALAGLAPWYGITPRELRRYRDMEHGAENRFTILNKLSERARVPEMPRLFLYMTEVVSLARDLSSFDALLCALMGLLGDLELLEPAEIDPAWGSVARPLGQESLRPEAWREQ